MQKLQEAKSWAFGQARERAQSMKMPFRFGTAPTYRLTVVTGDKRGAGTNANVYVIIHDDARSSRTIRPNHTFKDDHERGSATHIEFGEEMGVRPPFESIEVWRDNFGGFSLPLPPAFNQFFFGGKTKDAADWFLDRIEIRSLADLTEAWVFPVHRWINDGPHYFIPLYDCRLPQYDVTRKQFRKEELDFKRKKYIYERKIKDGPTQVLELPTDEMFSLKFYWTFMERRTVLLASNKLINWKSSTWNSIEDLQEVFKLGFEAPEAIEVWKEDWWFGLQRVQGVDPTILRLCESVPENVAVPDTIERLLDGRSFEDALRQRKIFICNLSILDKLKCKDDRELSSPIALFHLNSRNELLPILIQLRQEKSQYNPVYTPLDRTNTWLLAKMYYNNAEAQNHQSLTHLGFTHLLMEGVCAALHRCLSASHPVFRLLAPHFLYLIAINKRGEEKLINPGGWVDLTMTQGTEGMFELMGKAFQKWNFMRTDPRYEIKERGLIESRVLPYYPYRDDAICLYVVIRNYVENIVHRYYESDEIVQEDWEINAFHKELTSPYPQGIALEGVPGFPEKGFMTVENVIVTITGIISTCSLGHAAANSQQYRQYAFVPNYPGFLARSPPTEKNCYTEAELLALLPPKSAILDTIVISNLLSTPITNQLGDFEVQYMYDPEDIKAADCFRDELQILSQEIQRRNQSRILTYEDLDPAFVPNSISI